MVFILYYFELIYKSGMLTRP